MSISVVFCISGFSLPVRFPFARLSFDVTLSDWNTRAAVKFEWISRSLPTIPCRLMYLFLFFSFFVHGFIGWFPLGIWLQFGWLPLRYFSIAGARYGCCCPISPCSRKRSRSLSAVRRRRLRCSSRSRRNFYRRRACRNLSRPFRRRPFTSAPTSSSHSIRPPSAAISSWWVHQTLHAHTSCIKPLDFCVRAYIAPRNQSAVEMGRLQSHYVQRNCSFIYFTGVQYNWTGNRIKCVI